MKKFYLYKIENKVNGKLYIGITQHPDRRKKQHFNPNRKTRSYLLAHVIDRYGVENFEFSILCVGSRDYIVDLERKSIVHYNSQVPNGYNVKPGGEGNIEGYKIQKSKRDVPVFARGFWFPNLRTCVEKLKEPKKKVLSRRKEGTLGEMCWFDKERKSTKGSTIAKNKNDRAIFVQGFWFPAARYCLRSLNIPKKALYARLKDGTAGDLQWFSKVSRDNEPVYISGFWFPYVHIASHILKLSTVTIWDRIRFKNQEEFVANKGIPKRRVSVDGVIYASVADAMEQSDYKPGTVKRKLKNKEAGFQYLD